MNAQVIESLIKTALAEGAVYLPTLQAALNAGPLTGALAPFEPYRAEVSHVVGFLEWAIEVASHFPKI